MRYLTTIENISHPISATTHMTTTYTYNSTHQPNFYDIIKPLFDTVHNDLDPLSRQITIKINDGVVIDWNTDDGYLTGNGEIFAALLKKYGSS